MSGAKRNFEEWQESRNQAITTKNRIIKKQAEKIEYLVDELENLNAAWSLYALSDNGHLAIESLEQIKEIIDRALTKAANG